MSKKRPRGFWIDKVAPLKRGESVTVTVSKDVDMRSATAGARMAAKRNKSGRYSIVAVRGIVITREN